MLATTYYVFYIVLNAMLGGYKKITDLTYNRNEYLGQTKDSRKVAYDLLCTDNL